MGGNGAAAILGSTAPARDPAIDVVDTDAEGSPKELAPSIDVLPYDRGESTGTPNPLVTDADPGIDIEPCNPCCAAGSALNLFSEITHCSYFSHAASNALRSCKSGDEKTCQLNRSASAVPIDA